jgi:hypothetical protein
LRLREKQQAAEGTIMQLDKQYIMNDAFAGAIAFEADQHSRGIPPVETAAAAAMLIGLIVGEGADDVAQVERALGHLIKVMQLIAADCVSERRQVN